MRGKGPQHLPPALQNGITPAYAGKSFGSFCFLSFRQDHPRVCGEKQAAVALPQPVLGSPPRMRGKVELVHQTEGKVGITPACAGKSSHQHGAGRWRRDHPRVCGEKGCCKFSSRNHSGSPPRMRGKDLSDNELQVLDGITPAYAGKSVIRISDGCLRRDHPRVCGEKAHLRKMSCLLLGSPPRMRGKGRCHHPVIFVDRITPAYAGKSLLNTDNTTAARDHPRVCGEKTQNPIGGQFQQGSPPAYAGKSRAGA